MESKSVKLSNLSDFAPLLLRLGLGISFMIFGLEKIFNLGEVSMFFSNLGVLFPKHMAYFVSYAELIGGLLILLGLFTRIVAICFSFILPIAIVLIRVKVTLAIEGSELPLTHLSNSAALISYLFGFLVIVILGHGRLSLDGFLKSLK